MSPRVARATRPSASRRTPTKGNAPTTSARAQELIRSNDLLMVDLKFVDLPGTWQHFSIPVDQFTEDLFSEGIGFDGSSIRGFQHIHESDMLLVADPSTAIIDPACTVPTLSLVCNVLDPLSRQPYTRDPRHVAQKAERYLAESGIADISYWGPEAEFFVFSSIRFDAGAQFAYHYVDSDEGIWNSGLDSDTPNLGHRPRWKEGYFPVPPTDTLQDLRSEMALKMIAAGIEVEVHHHEVATGGQNEIDMRFGPLTQMADRLMLYKYIIKNVARARGKTATFMPKPLFGDNGSGMHCHQSLWKGTENLFFDANGYALISQTAKWYIGGLLAHSPALLGLCAPTTNSYRRLVPGFEAPVNLIYSQRNRSAGVRIPVYSTSPKSKRIEYRCPDASCNPYLAFAAMLMAGLDGIRSRIDPGQPMDKDRYELEPADAESIKQVPGSLSETLDALEADHAFLLEGNVFTPDLIETWIDYKRTKEVDAMRLRPHPYEFYLYYDT
ncbi:MAG: type I glutamate--ammonia ligase [Gemmatimonadetes bacterium]|nr:MAG: type I glutamate--ammonia ligase [Gemmatimonadota bacterium]